MDVDHHELTHRDAPTWLLPWLDWLDAALHREILRLRTRYELSLDELRGLYVTDEQVDRLLRRPSDLADADNWAALDERLVALLAEARLLPESPLGDLARRFGLTEGEVLALVVCLAPEVDLSYQTIYAYLNDDISRRLPTVDLCRRLGGAAVEPHSASMLEGLLEAQRQPGAPLWRSSGLVLAEPARRHLLAPTPTRRPELSPGLVVLAARLPVDAEAWCASWARRAGCDLLRADDPSTISATLLEARVSGSAVHVVGEFHGLGDGLPPAEALRLIRSLTGARVPVVLSSPAEVVDRLPLAGVEHELASVRDPDVPARVSSWSDELLRHGFTVAGGELTEVARLYRLSHAQIRAAVTSVARTGDATPSGLGRAARRTSSAGLAGVAQRIEASYTWDDLVLPTPTLRRLRHLEGAIRHRDEVFGQWAFGRLSGGHTSVRALFSGPSGTGKTMATSVLGGAVGLDVFRVDLSAVVSKYIGETEKNIEAILRGAEHSNAILLFDEADALFGKRSEVKDAHDRYANIEVAYLLQRLEAFDGIVVLATNLAANLDEAFGRRLQFVIEFPPPDVESRRQLWRRAFPAAAPVAADLDLELLASRFAITGGDVRAIALTAAFLAATDRSQICMEHVVRALARLRRQQGKLPTGAEFGEHLRTANEEA